MSNDKHRHGNSHDHRHDHEDEHDHGHGHAHGAMGSTSESRIAIAVGLNVIFVVVEAIFGWRSHSVALIADAGHNLSDVLGLAFAWGAMVLARKPTGAQFTYGLGRSSVLAALANAVLLLVVCGALAWESIGRLSLAPAVAGATVMWVAGAGIAVNGFSAWLLHGGQHDMNMRAAFLHMLGDAAISAAVVIAGFLILKTGREWIDPVVSLGVVGVILASTWGLLRDALRLSLDGVPAGLNRDAVRQFIAAKPGVTSVHDVHIWALSTTSTALTAHLTVPDAEVGVALLSSLMPELKLKFNIHHATLQIEREVCEQDC